MVIRAYTSKRKTDLNRLSKELQEKIDEAWLRLFGELRSSRGELMGSCCFCGRDVRKCDAWFIDGKFSCGC